MNIAFFTDSYTPQMDGVVRSIQLYKKSLEDLGHQVYIFAPRNQNPDLDFKQPYEEEENVFRFRSVRSSFVPGYPLTLPISFKATRKIPKLKLDIIHVHTQLTMGMFAEMVALFKNTPLVFTYHTLIPEYSKYYFLKGKMKSKEIAEKFDTFYCNRANCVITPSEKLKKILQGQGVKSKLVVLPTGVDLNEFSQKRVNFFYKKFGIHKNKKILLFVGRINKEKNLEFLLQMMKYVLLREKDAFLVFVGDGKGRKDLERKATLLNLKNNVFFSGFLNRKETVQAFLDCYLFVFSSKTETQGLVLLEAAAAGKPIVMINDPNLTKAVISGRNGFIVEEDERIFSERINLLLRDRNLYDRMSLNSKRIAQDFSIKEQAKKLIKIYESVISEHRSSSRRIKFWHLLHQQIKIPNWLKEQF